MMKILYFERLEDEIAILIIYATHFLNNEWSRFCVKLVDITNEIASIAYITMVIDDLGDFEHVHNKITTRTNEMELLKLFTETEV